MCVCVCVRVWVDIYIYIFNKFPDFFVQASKIVVGFYEMIDQFLWFQVQMNSYSSNRNTPYESLIVTGGEFQKHNLDNRTL